MAGFNRVILVGTLVRDPEMRRAGENGACTEFRFAVDDTHRSRTGELVRKSLYIDVVTWGSQAESVHRCLSRGSRALIEGRLQSEEWRNAEGQIRSAIRIVAYTVQFLDPPAHSPSSSDYSGNPESNQRPNTGDVSF